MFRRLYSSESGAKKKPWEYGALESKVRAKSAVKDASRSKYRLERDVLRMLYNRYPDIRVMLSNRSAL
jgi:hypothetical protein